MKDSEHFFFMLPQDAWRKKPSPSTHKMTREYAAKYHPGAEPILSSREVRRSVAGHPLGATAPYARRDK